MNESEAAEIVAPLAAGVGRAGARPHRSERATIKAAQRGSADAIERLVREHWQGAYRVALGMLGDRATAEDVAQEALMAAVRALPDFDRGRPFRPWVHRIVVNRALDAIRVRRRRSETELVAEPEDARVVSGPHGGGELLSLLDGLDPRDRAVVVLRHLVGFNSAEIADMLDLSDGTVRSILHRTLARLREQFESEDAR